MKLKQLIFSTIDQKDESGKRFIALKYAVKDLEDELKITELAILDDPELKTKGITNSEKRKQYLVGETLEERAEIQNKRIVRDLEEHNHRYLHDRLTFLQSIFDIEGDQEALEEEK